MHPTTPCYLTSFGPFLNVVDNPSQRIAEFIEDWTRARSGHGSAGIDLVQHTNLEVSFDGVDAYFASTLPSSMQLAPSTGNDGESHQQPTRWRLHVHLGVHRGAAGQIRVETRAINDIHAPEGDFKGVRRVHERIVGREEMPTYLNCAIPQDVLASTMTEVNSAIKDTAADAGDAVARFVPQLISSDDAGRYLCNYCYFSSLKRNQESADNVADVSVFIHVLDPERGEIDASGGGLGLLNPTCEAQARCILTFLDRLSVKLNASV